MGHRHRAEHDPRPALASQRLLADLDDQRRQSAEPPSSDSSIERAWTQRVDGRPYVQSTRIISVPEAGGQAYRANEVIEVAFTFDTRVVVEGDACVTLYLGYGG